MPFSSRSTSATEVERWPLSSGPRIALGFTTARRSVAFCSRARSQAARSAIVFERGYGLSPGRSGSVQSSSFRGRSGSGPAKLRTAATEEVTTTRFTPEPKAARSTRRVPSRAGTISSLGSLGCEAGKGEATCRTYSHPATASCHPSSLARSACTTDRPALESRWDSIIARSSCSRAGVAHGGPDLVPALQGLHRAPAAEIARGAGDEHCGGRLPVVHVPPSF